MSPYTGRVIVTCRVTTETSGDRPWERVWRARLTAHVAVLALFLALAGIWLRPLPWRMTDHVTGPGDPLTTAWRLVWPAQWLTERSAPFWETNVLYPASGVFARDELTLGQSVIAVPIYAATRNALVAYNMTLLVTLALSGFAMYCLAWHFLRNRAAGIVAGIIFALAPYHLAQLDHAGLLAVQWLPLVILFLDRTLHTRRWRDAALLGAVVLLQPLAAGYYAYWSAFAIVVLLGYVGVARRRLVRRRALAQVGATLAIAFLILLPIAAPFKRAADTEGFARPMREVEYWSARPQTWLAATPHNRLYGGLVRAHAWTWSTEMYLFPGALAIGLGIVSFIGAARGRVRWFALVLACAGFVLSLGPYLHLARRDAGRFPLPYLLLYRLIPGGDALRAPVRAAPVAMLGIALLAAIGWKRIEAWLRGRHCRRWAPSVLATLACLILCAEYAIAPLHTVRVPQLRGNDGSLVEWLRAQPPSIVAVLPDPRAPVTMALATTNRHRFINGDAEIMPPASRALFDVLRAFPTQESVTALEALGVDLPVLDHAAMTAAELERIAERIAAFPADLTPTAALSGATVYRVAAPRAHFGPLLDAIPASSSVCIGGVPPDDRTYLDRAMIAHLLRDRRVRGDLKTGWTSEPAPPHAGERCNYALLASSGPIPDHDDARSPLWSDGTLALYRERSD